MNKQKLKREDFTTDINGDGYMVKYKGEGVCGAGIIKSSYMKTGRTVRQTIANCKMYSESAELDIAHILSQGKKGRYYDTIKQIEGIIKIRGRSNTF